MAKITTQQQWELFGEIEEKGVTPVYYSNQIARMRTRFTLEEEKVLHVIFSKLNAFEKNDLKVTINKSELFDTLGVAGKSKYKRYRNIFKGIIQKSYMEILDTEGNMAQGVVITGVKWNTKEQPVELYLNQLFMPYISELVSNFTMVSLQSITNFKSKYSLVVYRWLCSWADNSTDFSENARYITTKELKELFGLTEQDYVYNGKFNRALFEQYAIESAVHEINEKTDLQVEYKKIKQGNRIKSYAFHFVRNRVA